MISCTVKVPNLEHPKNWMKLAHNQLFPIFLCRKKLFLHAKIIKNQNQLVHEQFSGCSKLGRMFQVRFFYGMSFWTKIPLWLAFSVRFYSKILKKIGPSYNYTSFYSLLHWSFLKPKIAMICRQKHNNSMYSFRKKWVIEELPVALILLKAQNRNDI